VNWFYRRNRRAELAEVTKRRRANSRSIAGMCVGGCGATASSLLDRGRGRLLMAQRGDALVRAEESGLTDDC
jgi:hypothetical protein